METVVRVVIADADEHTRNLAHLTFASDQWSVREATDAAGAVRVIAAEVPELLVIDAELPTAGGLATIRALRRQPQTASVGALLLVDGARRPAADSVEQVGAHVLERPIDPFTLLDAVRQVLATG